MMISRYLNKKVKARSAYRASIGGLLTTVCLLLASAIYAVPPDATSMSLVRDLMPVIASIKQGTPWTDQHSLELLQKGASSNDQAVIAITAWCLGHTSADSYDKIFETLQARKLDKMPEAFVEIAAARKTLQKGDKRAYFAKLEAFDQSENPYLRIEAAREWKSLDRNQALLKHKNLLSGKRAIDPRLRDAVRQSKKTMGEEDLSVPVPFADDRYKVVIDTLFD